MTPQLIHRYSWPVREAIEHLLDEVVGDCTAWQVRIEGEELVIDVVEPGAMFSNADGSPNREIIDRSPKKQAEVASKEVAKINTAAPEADAAPAEPPRKGGALARQAGIICGEKGFWTFIAKKCGVTIGSADEAAFWLKERCGVASRVDFDHDAGKAANFREIEKAYRYWLDGYDD
jgi:hypothetical protein